MIALTHIPSPNMEACERTFIAREAIHVAKALEQHAAYCRVLNNCGAKVRTLDVNRAFPDCTFIEDTAVVLDEVAVITSMGAPSRSPEPAGIEPVLAEFRPIRHIEPPATIEGGDVLRVGRTLLVGESRRTNAAGISALAAIARPLGYREIAVPVTGCLHLKSACTALPDGRLLVNPAWLDASALAGFELVHVPADEPDAANVALVGAHVIIAAARARTAEMIGKLGFDVHAVELAEFAKAEGCATCLSLIFS